AAVDMLAVGWRVRRAVRHRWHRGLHVAHARAGVGERDRGAHLRFPLAAGSALRQKADGITEAGACGLLLAWARAERGMDSVIGKTRICLDRQGDARAQPRATRW